jgi:hypothetical protein
MITKIVTSFGLNRIDRQRCCVASWRKLGLPIIAVQCDEQVEQLRAIFGDLVDSFTSLPSQPNAWGRPHLARVANHAKQTQDGPILLINSDIEIRDAPEQFAAEWMGGDADTLICGIRRDHHHGTYHSVIHPYGIDAFRITPAMAESIPDDGFVIGSPGWDYWLPWRMSQNGYKIRAAKSQLMHEIHDMGYDRQAVEIAHGMMLDRFNVPPNIMTLWIQWATDRVGMRHRKGLTGNRPHLRE